MLKKLQNTMPFAKIGIQGFAGDGKSYTASVLAVGIHKLIGSTKPIAVFDTERAFKSLKNFFDKNNVEVLIDDDNRSLAALNAVIKECEDGAADILIIDSITHIYEEFLSAYKAQKRKNNTVIEFQDWGVIKPKWKKEFSNRFVESNLHIIFTGRSGIEYENEINDETGKREIFKSGVKMKAENETAFEPDLLIDMRKEKVEKGMGNRRLKRVATIIKDRTTMIDGKEFVNPTFNNFKPCILQMLDGKVVQEESKIIADKFDELDDKSQLTRFRKDQAISTIESIFKYMKLGTSVADKAMISAILKTTFPSNPGTYSIDQLIMKPVEELESAIPLIEIFSKRYLCYLEDCELSNSKPDGKEIGAILHEVLSNEINV